MPKKQPLVSGKSAPAGGAGHQKEVRKNAILKGMDLEEERNRQRPERSDRRTQSIMGEYDDLIYLPHPVSRKHPPMSAMDRAAQFSPFSAPHRLRGRSSGGRPSDG